MATMKMCKQSNETCQYEATGAMATHGVCGNLQAPEKKHHFWHKNKNEQAKQQGHGIKQCYGLGGKKAVKGNGCVQNEGEEFVVMHTRVEKTEEHVSVVRVKNKPCVKANCGDGWQLGFLKD